MQVRLSRAADTELTTIYEYIANESPTRADGFVNELLDRCFGLATHPERYPVVAEHRGKAVRRVPFRTYVVLYSVEQGEVRIHHIVHGARDYIRLLFPDD